MDHSVKVGNWSASVEFPPDLKNRIFFDAPRKRLVFRDFMSKADYDRLSRLDEDLEYLRAIERLFQVSTEADFPEMRNISRLLGILVIACVIMAAVVWWQLLRGPRLPAARGQASVTALPEERPTLVPPGDGRPLSE
jgi:hypothetical protein